MLGFLTQGLYDDIDNWLKMAKQRSRRMSDRLQCFRLAMEEMEEIGRPRVRGEDYDPAEDMIERYNDPASPAAWKRRFRRMMRVSKLLERARAGE
ncbi:uncharacterized protein J3D65DRAFT_668288 [Phyllosticta citribraziliensis]|uniref:Uncharacterized protein n=1 Tax=Phyllosticta citribraziliensis TaxID=989973 RepID=A0ABR1LM41_9PEZI